MTALLSAGCPDHYYQSPAYFANTTRETVTVRVLELQADVACDDLQGRSGQVLGHRALFGKGTTYEVAPGEALPLYVGNNYGYGTRRTCAALLQLLGHPDQVVFWNGEEAYTDSKLAPVKDEAFRRVSMRLEGAGAVTGLAIGAGLEVTPLPPAASVTTEAAAPASFGWSGSVPNATGLSLLERKTLPDGCLSLLIGADSTQASRLFLCVPDWAFPFQVGQQLNISSGEVVAQSTDWNGEDTTARRLVVGAAKPAATGFELWLNATQKQVSRVQSAVVETGDAHRTPCGGYADSLSLRLAAPDNLALSVGVVAESRVSGQHKRALLGRADAMLVAPDGCDSDFGTLGERFDLLMVEETELAP